jgi:galactokinase/mevalonate kinase-like predicted kinase
LTSRTKYISESKIPTYFTENLTKTITDLYMPINLYDRLKDAAINQILPAVVAYNRIDGPGSSLDLRSFQQALWSLPVKPQNIHEDPSMKWSRHLPRTIGITIDTGTRVEAHPLAPDQIGVQSIEYGTKVFGKPGEVIPTRENWLLKILDIFGLSGVMFVLHNLRTGTHSAGLGGSATATTGVCILANELAGRPFSNTQLVSMASCMEQDLGVSITGTQEQANVIFGGIIDYIWYPWGVPGQHDSGYGASIRTELLSPKYYADCEQRMAIFHSGTMRASTDVNTVWTNALSTLSGYALHAKKPEIAYEFREGLRLRQWNRIKEAIDEYRQVRTNLCSDYLAGAHEIVCHSEMFGCTAFPLGAGGGGGVFVFSAKPESLVAVREDMKGVYREIPIKIRPTGHELINLPLIGV